MKARAAKAHLEAGTPRSGNAVKHVVSKREKRERRELVEELILRSTSKSQIEAAMRARYAIGPSATAKIVNDVRERWLAERGSRTLMLEKEEQVRRLKWLIAKCREGKDGKQLDPPDWDKATISKCEHELAKILGTYEPEKLELDVVANRTVLMLLEHMNPDELDALTRAHDARAVIDVAADDVLEETAPRLPH